MRRYKLERRSSLRPWHYSLAARLNMQAHRYVPYIHLPLARPDSAKELMWKWMARGWWKPRRLQ